MMKRTITDKVKTVGAITCLVLLSSLCFISCSDDDETAGTAPQPTATGTWTDERDGTEYGWVRYGSQEWTTSNLRYQPAKGGTMPDMTPVNPRYYDDGVATRYFNTFGLLYNHKAALAAVPEGWRLPTDEDWIKLAENTNSDIRKAINLGLAGCFIDDELFIQLHNVEYYTYIYGYYWTATTDDTKTGENFAYYRKLTWNKAGSERESMKKSTYMSVRLVRDVK